jgi:nitrite reductase (NADH) small subunit
MGLVRIGLISDFPPGSLNEVRVGEDLFAVCHSEGEIHVLDGYCPHRQGPLGQGALHGCMVVCPWHAWEFDCRNGEFDYNPDVKVKKYRSEIRDGEVFVDAGRS